MRYRGRGPYRIIWGDLSEAGHLGELRRDKMELFKMIFKK